MHVIFNDININGKEIWETEYRKVPKQNELGFEIGISVNETQVWKTTINNTFFHISYVNVNISTYEQKPAQAETLYNYNMNRNYSCHTVSSFCLLWYKINKNE